MNNDGHGDLQHWFRLHVLWVFIWNSDYVGQV
jgi:hypothetical protein